SKPLKVAYPSGTAIGFLESPKHFGPIRTPIGGVLLELNQRAIRDPRLVTDSPYGEGWVAQLRPSDLRSDRAVLLRLPADQERFAKQIDSLRVRDRKSTRLNSSHVSISYAVFCLKKKT